MKGLGASIAKESFDPKAYDGDGDGKVQDGSTFERPSVPFVMPNKPTGLRSLNGSRSASSFRDLTNEQIVQHAIPDNPTDFIQAIVDGRPPTEGKARHLSNFARGLEESYGTSEIFDFSPETVKALRVAFRDAIDNNPAFADAIRDFGFPPLAVAKKGIIDSRHQGGYEPHYNFMLLNQNQLGKGSLYARMLNATNEVWTGGIGMKGTDRKLVYTGSDGVFTHEFGHYATNMAMRYGRDGSPQKDLASIYALDSWFDLDNLRPWVRDPDALHMIDSQKEIIDAINNKDEVPKGIPFINSQYGQQSPSEMMAEAIGTYLNADTKHHEHLNPVMKSHVIKLLGKDYSTGEKVHVLKAETDQPPKRTPFGLRSQGPQPPTGMGNVHMPARMISNPHDIIGEGDPNEAMVHRDPFGGHRPTSIDWLKHASDEEIARLVTPESALDHAIMIVQQAHIQNFDKLPKQQILLEIAETLQHLHGSHADYSARHGIDYSAVDEARDEVMNALKNPAFAWYVRTFGMPPVTVVTPASALEARNRPQGSKTGNVTGITNGVKGGYVGAWFDRFGGEMSPGIVINRAHYLVGSEPAEDTIANVGEYPRTDGSLARITGNVAQAPASTLRHEYGHYLWWRLTRDSSTGVIRNSLGVNVGTTQNNTLSALGVDSSTAQKIADSLRELYDIRNGTSLGDPSITRPYWGQYITSKGVATRNKNYHPAVFADERDSGFPIVNSAYGHHNPQENFAESFTAFTSEYAKIRAFYLDSNTRNTIAMVTGVAVTDGKHDKPWERNVSGLASRASVQHSSRAAGKGSIVDRAKDELKLNERQVSALNAQTQSIHDSFTDGSIYKEPIFPEIDGRRQELLDSIRVVKAEGGLPMIIAEPNPIFNAYLPVKRDWSAIEVPPREAVADVFKKLISNSGDGPSDTENNGYGKFTDYLYSIVEDIRNRGGELPMLPAGEGKGYRSWIQDYYNSLRDPAAASTFAYASDGLHDVFGHYGTGRAYDRHGEWANFLALKDMIDNAPDLTDDEKNSAFRFWFREYGLPHLIKRGELDDNNVEYHDLHSKIAKYNGDFGEILRILDSGHNGKEDSPHGLASQGSSIKDTPIEKLQDAVVNDVESEINSREPRLGEKSIHASTPSPRPWVEMSVKSFIHNAPKHPNLSVTNPGLHRKLYVEILHGEDGGPAGTWTAKKALLLARRYEEQGGTYKGQVRTIQRSMQRWTRETTTGKIRNGNLRRYVPSDSWSRRSLSPIQISGSRASIGRRGRSAQASTTKPRTIGRNLRNIRG